MKYDLPINNSNDDKLKFTSFSEKISQQILNYSEKETLIFSIEGKWGTGKTSLINLVENQIDEETIILKFNPWLITDIEVLIEHFFNELLKVIIKSSIKAKIKEDVLKDLQKYFNSYMRTIVRLFPEINIKGDIGIFKVGTKVNFSSLEDKFEDAKDLNIYELKSKINDYLQNNLKKKIVIVVDDIDRLTDKETEFIFRLTKGIADFDNLIYILLYDKEVVIKSLETFKRESGERYLEKIVQYSLSVPKPHQVTIKKLLAEELNKIFEKLELEKKEYIFDKKRWNEVFLVIDKYIKNVRDINQIINIISFEYPIISEEVNFSDFFIVSLIKLKNHKLYEVIKNQPENFFINPNNSYVKEKDGEKIRENFENNFKEYHNYRDLLKICFPILNHDDYVVENKGYSSSHKNKYINNIYYHESYFSFSMSDDKMSMREYYQIREAFLSKDYISFKKLILDADQHHKTPYFVDMFYNFDESLQANEIENIFFNTLQIAPQLVTEEYIFSVSFSYENLGYDILLKHPNIESFILNCYQTDSLISLRIKVRLLEKINEEIKKEYSNKKPEISNEVLIKLNDIIKLEIEDINIEKMVENKKLSYLVRKFDFIEVSYENLASELLLYAFETNNNFFNMLEIFRRTSHVTSSHVGKYEKHSISKETLKILLDLKKVESHIKNIDLSTLSDENKKLIEYWNNDDRW